MNENIQNISLNDIVIVSNTRSEFEGKTFAELPEKVRNELKELAVSIKSNGLIQAITVKPLPDGKFRLICGERRYRASLLAGLPDIRAQVLDIPEDKILQFQIVENLQRKGVSVMDEVRAIVKMVKKLGMTEAEAGKAIGKSNSHIFNQLLISKSAPEVQEALEKNQIYRQVAIYISKLDADKQVVAVNGLKRDNPAFMVKAKEAEHWINQKFGVQAKKPQTGRFTPKNNGVGRFASDWKYYFIRFSAEQFTEFQGIVGNRTDFQVWAEAVETVMTDGNPNLTNHAKIEGGGR